MARRDAPAGASDDAYHVGAAVWVADGLPKATPSGRALPTTWLQARVTGVEGPPGDRVLALETDDGRAALTRVRAADCPLQNARDDTLDDLVRADFLHEPG